MREKRVPVSESEYRVLRLMAERGFRRGTLEEAAGSLGLDKSSLASIAMLLAEKGLIRVWEEEAEEPRLTEKGRSALETGLPEEKLLRMIAAMGGEASVGDVRDALGAEAGPAIGMAKRKGLVEVAGGRIRLLKPLEEALRAVEPLRRGLLDASEGRLPEEGALEELRRRGLVRLERRRILHLEVAGDPRRLTDRVVVEVSRLTPEMLRTGEWRRYSFRAYNVAAEPPRVLPARRHFFQEFIEMLRDIMRELGFVEVHGPLVELELFNFDVLFQAQDHPAREIHDTLWVREPRTGSLEPYRDLVERVARVHREGWRYEWDARIAARLILRSQTTAVSARVLAGRPEPPVRVFTIGKVFRSDAVSPTRLPEFHQLDGIEGEPGYTFRDLLGRLEEIAGMMGFKVRFKPAYFPFTEPSVEGYVRLPNGRWLELFGAGMFRPEVLEAVGVDYPVGAWGFGIERLAMAYYGITDIRQLYTRDIDEIRSFPAMV